MGDTYTPPPMPEGFNPYTQSVTLFYPDGSNGTFSMTDINLTLRSATTYSSSYGAQVGACTILLIILLIITPPAKRRSLHFGLNVFGLIVAIARGILCIHYYMSPWTDAYAMLGGDYSACSFSDKLLSVAPGGLMVLLQLDVQLALVLQMRIVLESTPTLNMIITFFTSAIALVSLGFLFSIQVEGNKAIMDDYTWYPDWKRTASNTFFLISIICFATVFSVKLGIAIRRRRLLGLEGFGPMQVIFTMGCQTMFVPGKYLRFQVSYL